MKKILWQTGKSVMVIVVIAEIKNSVWIGHINNTKGELKVDKDNFGKTEGRLYRYFENIRKIAALKEQNIELENRYESAEKDLRTSNFNFDVSIGSIGFEERVQTSCSGESSVERQMFQQAERLIKEQKIIRKNQFRNQVEINELERNNIKIRVAVSMLDEEQKKFIYFKYNKKMPIEGIAEELNLSIRTTYRLRKQIIEEVMKLI